MALIGLFGVLFEATFGGFSAASGKGHLWQRPRLVNMGASQNYIYGDPILICPDLSLLGTEKVTM